VPQPDEKADRVNTTDINEIKGLQ